MKKIYLTILIAFTLQLNLFAEKGLYVDGFASILGNTNKEDSLLNYAQQNGFTYLALYELQIVHASNDLTTVLTSQPLATFILKAKTMYSILEVGACGENFWWFDNIISVYNTIHSNPNEKIDVYNLEFEFWNTGSVGPGQYYCTTYLTPGGFSCDTTGAFGFYMKELTSIDSLAAIDGVTSEIYVGWFNAWQASQMILKADRILLHSYVTNVNNVYSYTQTRLSYLGSGAGIVDVMPIFSSEPGFLGPWLSLNPEPGAYTSYTNDFALETGLWKTNINLLGYQWFAYSFMPYGLPAGVEDITKDVSRVYPNPFLSKIDIENNLSKQLEIEVLNSHGELIYSGESSSKLVPIYFDAFTQGIYFLCIYSDGQLIVQKLIKQ